MTNLYLTVVNAINKIAQLVEVADCPNEPTALYTWRAYSLAELEDIKELFDILCISYEEDFDCCGVELYATCQSRGSKKLVIRVKCIYKHEL